MTTELTHVKIESALRETLARALPGEKISVLLRLHLTPGDRPAPPAHEHYQSWRDWQVAMLAWRNSIVDQEMGDTLLALEQLGFHPYGQVVGRVVGVEGEATVIRQALELPGIEHAFLASEGEPEVKGAERAAAPTPLRLPSALWTQLTLLRRMLPDSPLGQLVADTEQTLADSPELPQQILKLLGQFAEGPADPADAVRSWVNRIMAQLKTPSTRERMQWRLQSCLAEVGASSATFYVQDPWWPDDYLLVFMPGVRYPEPMYGFNSPGTARRVLTQRSEKRFFPDARELEQLRRDGSRPGVSGGRRTAALNELAGRNKLFGDFLQREGIASCARLLLRNAEGQVFATLFVNFATPTTFPEELCRELEQLGDDLRAACGELLHELQQPFPPAPLVRILQPVQQLAAFGLGRSALALRDWLNPILGAVLAAFGIEQSGLATLHLFEPETDNLRLAAHRGHIDHLEEAQVHSLARGEGVISWVALKRRPILIADLAASDFGRPGPLRIHRTILEGARSQLAVPMLAGDELLGVLNLESTVPHAFWTDSVRVISYAANQAAIACRLFREVGAQRDLASLGESLLQLCRRAAQEGTSARQAFDELAEVTCTALNASICDLWRWVPTTDSEPGTFAVLGAYAADPHDPDRYQERCGPRPRGWTAYVHEHQQAVWLYTTDKGGFQAVYWYGGERGWDANPPHPDVPTDLSPNLKGRQVECELGIPILDGARCLGVAWLKYRREQMRLELLPPAATVQLAGNAALVLCKIKDKGETTELPLPEPRIIRLADWFSRHTSPLLVQSASETGRRALG